MKLRQAKKILRNGRAGWTFLTPKYNEAWRVFFRRYRRLLKLGSLDGTGLHKGNLYFKLLRRDACQ